MRQLKIFDLQLDSLAGTKVSSKELLPFHTQEEPVELTPEDKRVARAIPFYPAEISFNDIIRVTHFSRRIVAMVLNRVTICNHYRICQEGKKYCRLKEDLSNVD
jgi:hypothetical protein